MFGPLAGACLRVGLDWRHFELWELGWMLSPPDRTGPGGGVDWGDADRPSEDTMIDPALLASLGG